MFKLPGEKRCYERDQRYLTPTPIAHRRSRRSCGAVPSLLVPRRTKAQTKQLKILQWKHFVPGYDQWFNETYVKEWGEKNQVEVIVENVGLGDLGKRAMEDVAAKGGTTLFNSWLRRQCTKTMLSTTVRFTRSASAGMARWLNSR